jgi:protein MpaA
LGRRLPLAGALALVAGCGSAGLHSTERAAARRGLAAAWRSSVVGRSVRGRPIRAYSAGPETASRPVLVVGCLHGNETAGEAVTRRLRAVAPPAGVALWVVDAFNPDGCIAHTRENAHGVDLNRNSPWRWRHLDRPGGTYYAGPRPLSEPESRAINELVRRLRPAVTIWYHQHERLVDASGGDIALERRYAQLVGLPVRHLGLFPGSVTGWQNAVFPADTAFVVELPAGWLAPSAVDQHVAAVLALARACAQRSATPSSCSSSGTVESAPR